MANSIYNIPVHNKNKAYSKNDIVMVKETPLVSTGVPTNLKYYYALIDVPSGEDTLVTNSAYWGGYENINNTQSYPLFLWTPSYNVAVQHAPRVKSVIFGNGYQQRSPDGLYSGLIKIDLTFDKRDEKESRAILHFLKTQKGVTGFVVKKLPQIYADGPDNSYKKRFVCQNFNSTYVFHNNYSVKASFIQTNN